MIGLELRFLTGRFHANDWHHAHNEGIPEWPPSPWRVLRTLVAAAYTEQMDPALVLPLLDKLRALPRYRLPLASDAHTRHYMPDAEDARETRTKVFDAFVAIDGGARDPQPVTMAWDIELDNDEHVLLRRLARRVTYLGRAESWAEISVVDIAAGDWHCWPEPRAPSLHVTTLLALASADALARWAESVPKPRKGRDVPRSLWDVLTFEGARYRNEGWSEIPGTQRVRYVFAQPPFRRAVVPRPAVRRSAAPTVARYAIRSAVLPRITDALMFGERLRQAMMSRSKEVSGDATPVFSGHQRGASNHQHAMYLAVSEGVRPGFIDHVIVAARSGFDDGDVAALQSLRRLWQRGGHDLELVLIGLGVPSDFGGLVGPRSPSLAISRVWKSVTPFVPTRYPKVVRGTLVDGIAAQIARACEQQMGVAPVDVVAVGNPAQWMRFRRHRRTGGGRRGLDRAYGARLVFERPVQGPIALGYGCHFGLGLFAAVGDQ